MSHACPDSGGAHHFHPDEQRVPMCSCGEIEMSVDDELALIEMHAMPPLPADRARSFYTKVARTLGMGDAWVDEMVASEDRPAT